MCSSDFGMCDFLAFEEESLKTSLFSAAPNPMRYPKDPHAGSDVWKEKHVFEADDLLQYIDPTSTSDKSGAQFVDKFLCSESTLTYPDSPCDALQNSFKDDGFASLQDLGEFAFDSVMDSLETSGFDNEEKPLDSGSSDSGVSVDHYRDLQLSPSSHSGIPSSPDTLDAVSDVSSTSDLSSITELASFGPISPTPPRTAEPRISTVRVAPVKQQFRGNLHFLNELGTEKTATIIPKSKPTFLSNQTPTRFTIPAASSTIINASKLSSNQTQSKIRLGLNNGSTTFLKQSTTSGPTIRKVVTSFGGGLNGSSSSTGSTESSTSKSAFSTNPQTIVVTQGGKESILRNGSFLKTTNGRSILLPVSVGDLNQVRTIKIITSSGASTNRTGVRTSFSNVRPSITSSVTSSSNASASNCVTTSSIGTNNVRTALFTTTKGSDGRSLLKLTPTAMVTPNTIKHRHPFVNATRRTSSPMTIGEVCIKDEPMDEDQPQAGQPLILSDEEKRLLRKEGLTLPSKYPLTKMEERDLKRIRRKIRNKISAQDSRKRKKEYVDGLEDRVKNSSDENSQLQKRIKHLESQNENLVLQLRRLQSIIGGSNVGDRSSLRSNASTALMMIVLSAALFVAPSLRPENERELAQPGKMSNAGHTRSLLEVTSNIMSSLEGAEDDLTFEADPSASLNPLTDHDYGPLAKRAKMAPNNYYNMQDAGKTDPGDPPDLNFGPRGGVKGVASMIGAFLETLSSNWTDPGGNGSLKAQLTEHLFGGVNNQSAKVHSKVPAVVVNLKNNGRLRDDIELE